MNKPHPKPITSSRPSDWWQADLIEMRKDVVTASGHTFRYEVGDVSSRFLMTRPLVSETASNVVNVLQNIIYIHGPKILHTNRETEFQADVIMLCAIYNEQVIFPSPYNPQSNARGQTIMVTTMNTAVFNRVKGLQQQKK